MKQPTVEELLEKLREAREGSAGEEEQARRYRELLASHPTFTPALLELGRLLQRAGEPGVEAEETFAQVQRLLEQAVRVSDREAGALVELGYFLDTLRARSGEAFALYEEGAGRALGALEEAWAGMLRHWRHERTRQSLEKALRLGELAERLFPDSGRIQGAVQEVRQTAAHDGLLPP